MFWNKKSVNGELKKEKPPGPQAVADLVQKCPVAEWKMDPELAKLLKAVVVRKSNGEKAYHIQIFDGSDALARKVQVTGYRLQITLL